MPKKGLFIENTTKLLSSANDKSGWTLCIGAGTSMPLFPDWYTLAEEMAVQMVPDKPFNILDIRKCGFSPDAVIQMVKNSVAIEDIEFINQMSAILYAQLKLKIPTGDWTSVSQVLGANNISNCAILKWKTFSKYRDSVLNTTSAYQIAPIILEAIRQGNAPRSILSFNAEPLLFTILNSFLVDGCEQFPKKMFNKVISSISNQGLGTIPYIFCHGLLPVTDNPYKFSTSIDKLVFLEEEYLHIANNSFSWQSATFLNTCVSQHIVFIGTSLTDPNMRRWLSWTHSNRLDEMKQNGLTIENSTQHYWIRNIPNNTDTMPWIEAAVSHLGIRIIWIKDWGQLGLALKKMLGLSIETDKSIIKPRKKVDYLKKHK